MRALACVVFALVMVPCSALMLHRAVLAHRQLRSGPLRAHADVSSPPFRYRKLDHVVLRCARIDRMLRFYVDVLGAKPEWTDRFNGTLHHLRVGDSLIDLVTSDCDFAFANGTPEYVRSLRLAAFEMPIMHLTCLICNTVVAGLPRVLWTILLSVAMTMTLPRLRRTCCSCRIPHSAQAAKMHP